MKRIQLLTLLCMVAAGRLYSQATNIITTNAAAGQVLLGNYNPLNYLPALQISHPDSISRGLIKSVSADSLHAYLDQMRMFQNRNTGSDTVSSAKGIGAARRWALSKFQQFSQQSGNRLICSYLQFDQSICSITQHKNIFAVLPGTDTTDKSIVVIEAHFDSRCADLCDTSCTAEGMEDNGSGSALVLELARTMSRYCFRNSIVFLLTVSEEQGLDGARAFASYAVQKGMKIKAVLNNDVIGGVICGNTASPPGCSGAGSVDSTHVRLFTAGGFSSPHKGLARFVKLQYMEMIRPLATVPMTLHVMTPEDRTGRGGDHIPFRQQGFTAMRFTSANEHGDANVSNLNYSDRQHTSSDVLGVDTDTDQIIDSFFVDFNYLARNAVINGNAAAMAALGPKTPAFTFTVDGSTYGVNITQQQQYGLYRLGIRRTTYDWDTVFTFSGNTFTFSLPLTNYIASVASVDGLGIESLFSNELLVSNVTGLPEFSGPLPVRLLQNQPNPADEATSIAVVAGESLQGTQAFIVITDLTGRLVSRISVTLKPGINEVQYDHGYHAEGTYIYSLVLDGRTVDSKRMVFTK